MDKLLNQNDILNYTPRILSGFGWLQLSGSIISFIAITFGINAVALRLPQISFRGMVVLLISGILMIILGARARNIYDRKLPNYYLWSVVVVFSTMLALAFFGRVPVHPYLMLTPFLGVGFVYSSKLHQKKDVRQKLQDASYSITGWKWILIAIVSFMIFVIAQQIDSYALQLRDSSITQGSQSYEFISQEDGFTVVFPSEPEVFLNDLDYEGESVRYKILQAKSASDEHDYAVLVASYPDHVIENSGNKALMESGIQPIINDNPNFDVIDMSFSTHNSLESLGALLSVGEGLFMKVMILIHENKMYSLMVTSPEQNVPGFESFLNGFNIHDAQVNSID